MNQLPFRLSRAARFRIWSAPLWLDLRDRAYEWMLDLPVATRIVSHAGLFALVLLTFLASGISFSGIAKAEAANAAPVSDTGGAAVATDAQEFSYRIPNPVTNIPKRLRRDVIKYTVKPGDNVSSIADDFEISADSLLWANPKLEDNPDLLSVGQPLNIPPVSGVLVMVQSGDTLQKLADKYKQPKKKGEELIPGINNFEFNKARHELKEPEFSLTVGEFLMIPNAYKPYQARVVQAYNGPIPQNAARGSGAFGWPVSGMITQKYWLRHPGIDIGAPKGAPVYAADSGFVTMSGWSNAGYGFMILISHGNGYQTRYAHLSAMHVEIRESVKKGQMIGRVGSSGNSTGPHLHFEIIQGSGHRNPFILLPGR